MDALEGTQGRVRENGETSPHAPFSQRGDGKELEVILLNTAQKSPQKRTEDDFEEKGAKKAYLKKKSTFKPDQEGETRNHLGLLVSSQPGAPFDRQQSGGNPKKPARNDFNWKWDKQLNRLCNDIQKPEAGEFHQNTIAVVDNYAIYKRNKKAGLLSPKESPFKG